MTRKKTTPTRMARPPSAARTRPPSRALEGLARPDQPARRRRWRRRKGLPWAGVGSAQLVEALPRAAAVGGGGAAVADGDPVASCAEDRTSTSSSRPRIVAGALRRPQDVARGRFGSIIPDRIPALGRPPFMRKIGIRSRETLKPSAFAGRGRAGCEPVRPPLRRARRRAACTRARAPRRPPRA